MNLTATHLNYYRVCKRKLWLFANDITMEHNSDLVADGKVIEEDSYNQRNDKYSQINISANYERISLSGKIDFFNTLTKTIHETKRSNKVEQAHTWEAKSYLWLFEINAIKAVEGLIGYPKMRETEEVYLSEDDKEYLQDAVLEINKLIVGECPPVINAKICKSCSYLDFCYSGEE